MASPQHILVPVDFSIPSCVALDYASELAKKLGATLDALHVWQAPNFVPLVPPQRFGLASIEPARALQTTRSSHAAFRFSA